MMYKIAGLILAGLGLVGAVLNGFLSEIICITCFEAEKLMVFFVLLFVDIILIVSGASLILMQEKSNFKE